MATAKGKIVRKSQKSRREETQSAVMAAAINLFGECGYTGTSLQDIADVSGMTIRPVYHYYGNKEKLFLAVTEVMESRLANAIADQLMASATKSVSAGWQVFIEHVKDPAFRQVVLIDAPVVLGRERWHSSVVVVNARKLLLQNRPDLTSYQAELMARMAIAALAEAALMTAESAHPEAYSEDVGKMLDQFLSFLF